MVFETKIYLAFIVVIVILILVALKFYTLNKRFQEKLNQRENIFKVFLHDLKSPLGSYLNLIDVASYLIKTNQLVRLKELSLQIDKMNVDLWKMYENHYYWYLNEVVDSKKEIIQVQEFLKELNSLYINIANLKDIEIVVSVSKDATIYGDRNFYSVLFRNLIDNAIKNSPDESKIVVAFQPKSSDGFYDASIKNSVSHENVTAIENFVKSINTDNENRHQSIGLEFILKFAKLNDVRLEAIYDNHSLKVNLKLPVAIYKNPFLDRNAPNLA